MNQSSNSDTTTTTGGNKPVDQVRFGTVRAAIWRNVNEDGRVFYGVTVDRGYRDGKGDWQSSQSFGRDDLLVLAKVCDAAHTRICELQAEDREKAATGNANGAKTR